MPEKVVLYQDTYGNTYEVEIPLTSHVNPKEIRNKLGLPAYIDLNYFPMKTALVTLWAAQNAPELHKMHPSAYEKRISDKPINVLLFGGAAVKVLCEHANGAHPLARQMKDTDYIVPKKQGNEFYKLLLGMEKAFGTCYKSFKTKSDAIFNAMRQGDRYRIRTINGVTQEGMPTGTVLDIFCDSINLRHKINIKDEFQKNKENLHTIGLENLLLSKTQFIMDFPKADIKTLKKHNNEFRILDYPHYASDRLVLGMEEKDVKDACVIFLDHSLGNGPEEISADRMKKTLERDKKLALTVTLNLRNIADRQATLKKWMTDSEISTVVDRTQTLLQALPKIDKKWDKPWWNTAVETPRIE